MEAPIQSLRRRTAGVTALLLLAWAGSSIGSAGAQSPAERLATRPPAHGTASVAGRAVVADTGVALRAATVVLRISTGGSWTTTTDNDGLFLVEELPAGTYTLRITKSGFVPATGGRTPRAVGTFELREGQRLDRGSLVVQRGGVLIGRIIDDFGEPAAEMHVSAMRRARTT